MKIRKLLVILVVLAMVLGTFAACGKSEKKDDAAPAETQGDSDAAADADTSDTPDKKQMVVGIPSITDSFDFFNTTNGYESFSMGQVYDNLIDKDGEGNYIPCLAESWTISDDATEFTFNIHKDAKWSDGTPVTSKDVVFSMEQLKVSDYVSYIYEPLLGDMETPDDHTVVIKLLKPSVSFLEYLANPNYSAVLSQAAYEKYGDTYGTTVDTIVGSGPYKVTEWNVGASITYEANDDYHLGAPDIKSVKLVVMHDSNSVAVALQTGEIDTYFDSIPGVSYDTLAASDDITIYDWTSTILYCIFFNTQNGMFTDVNMRKAVAMALNKSDYITIGSEGYGSEADYPGDRKGTTIGDPLMHGKYDEMYAYNIEEASKLVEAAGNKGASVTIKTYSTDPYPALATVLQNALNEIGLDAKVEQIERATFIDKVLGEADFEIQVCRWAASTEDMNEIIYGSLHSDSMGVSGNWSFYANDELDKLIVDAAGETDAKTREELYQKVVQIFLDEMIYVSIYYPDSSRAYRNTITIGDGLQKYDRFYNYKWN